MNVHVLRALLSDALSQVLDNRVFRILCFLIAIPVLFTFLVGFREEHVTILFGWRTIQYADLFDFFDARFLGGTDIRQAVIQGYQNIVVAALAGSIGMMLTIAATAFFVPRMTEKGSADTLFSKPVSRIALYLSRYVSGLLFVAILSFVLILGIYLGLLLVSDYNDVGIFWSVLTLVYLFGLIHTVSMLVGLITRSTVAAILLALIFYTGNGCVHAAWELKEFTQALEAGKSKSAEEDTNQDTAGRKVLEVMILGLDAAHYTLPKTGDAPRIAAMLRRALEEIPPLYVDEHTNLALFTLPAGLVSEGLPAPAPYDRADPPPPGTRFELFRAGSRSGDFLAMARRTRGQIQTDPNERATTGAGRKETLFDAAQARRVELESDPLVTDLRDWTGEVMGREARFLSWRRGDRGGEHVVFEEIVRGRRGDWFVTLAVEHAAARLDAEGRSIPLAPVLETLGYVREQTPSSPDEWFAREFAWDAPLKFNTWFSLASSAAFAAVMLLAGWWRINRIDF